MYVCMFWHNYLSVNGIVSFSSFTWFYKYKEEYKQGEMWHSAQRTEISEEIYMFQRGRCQATGTWLISAENNEELLIARQRFPNHEYIDGKNWSRRLWKESNRQLQESWWRESTIYPGNASRSIILEMQAIGKCSLEFCSELRVLFFCTWLVSFISFGYASILPYLYEPLWCWSKLLEFYSHSLCYA
jgi:hypothetical protein